jgi:alkylated DNA repair protein alkB family protein 7
MEEGHYDGVIRHFREMHVTSWPESDVPGLPPLIERLQKLCPTPDTQTHILHLASNGEILPHVDNLQASGNWILGVSLGAERIMRMESTDGSDDSFDVLLPSGSVYLQRDTVRFHYRHSILKEGSFLGREIKCGPRLSIMIRDRLPVEHSYL